MRFTLYNFIKFHNHIASFYTLLDWMHDMHRKHHITQMIVTISVVKAAFIKSFTSSPSSWEGCLLPRDERWSHCQPSVELLEVLKEKRLYIFPTSAFFTCGAKSSQYIVKNLNLFCKTYEFFSGDCLLVERNTLTSCFLTFVTLPFSFLNLIFVEKKSEN